MIPAKEETIIQIRSFLITVPCKPTFAKSKLILYRLKSDTHEYVINELTSYNFSFNEMEGFKFYHSVLIDIKQSELRFKCVVFELNETSQTIVNIKLKSTETYNNAGIIERNTSNVFEGESFTLSCFIHFTLEEHFPIFWMNWTYPLLSDSELPIINELQPKYSNSSVVIHIQLSVNNASSTHEGWYYCDLLNTLGIVNSSKIFVPVFNRNTNKFKFITSINTTDAIIRSENTNFTLEIDVYSTVDLQLLNYKWTKDETFVDFYKYWKYYHKTIIFSETAFDYRKGKIIFTINDLKFKDSAVYSFVNDDKNLTFTLQVQGSPLVSVSQASVFYMENQQYFLDCEVTAFPQPKIRWEWTPCTLQASRCHPETYSAFVELEANNVQVVQSTSTINNDYKLRLEFISNYSGVYRCVASNAQGNSSKSVSVIVSDAGERGISMNASTTSPFESESLKITCKSSFYVFSAIHWLWRENSTNITELVMADNMHKIEKKGEHSLISELEIVNVSLINSGLFACNFEIAEKQKQGKLFETLNITIDVIPVQKPEIIDSNLNGLQLWKVPQSFIELQCNTTGNPKPVITWFKDNNLLNSTKLNAIDIDDDGYSMAIQKLAPSDSGIYECVAQNIAGIARRNITLIIEEMNLFTSNSVIISVFAAVFISILLFVSFLIVFRKHRMRKRREKEQSSFTEMKLFLRKSVWEFSRDRLKILKMIGEGSFGIVYLAEAIGLSKTETTSLVALKTMKDANNSSHRKALFDELKIFTKIGNHINIVNLLGVVTRDMPNGQVYAIVEYCKYGNLRNYLQSRRNQYKDNFVAEINARDQSNKLHHSSQCLEIQTINYTEIENNAKKCVCGETVTTPVLNSKRIACNSEQCSNMSDDFVTTNHLFSFSFQIAKGMQYLATRQLIHRDLAARNVLLADGGIVKITDFGLAKRHFETDFYVKQSDTPLPVKWMAIESLRDNVFTSKSDVWSFGVLLWELFSFGENPYPGIPIDAEFYVKLKNGYRMDRPERCPYVVFEIMKSCWNSCEEKRPDFLQLSEAFFALLDLNSQQYYTQILNS